MTSPATRQKTIARFRAETIPCAFLSPSSFKVGNTAFAPSTITAVSEEFAVDPENSLNWASTIAKPNEQWDTIKNLGHQWYNLDQAAAEQWMQNQNFAPEEIREITKPK